VSGFTYSHPQNRVLRSVNHKGEASTRTASTRQSRTLRVAALRITANIPNAFFSPKFSFRSYNHLIQALVFVRWTRAGSIPSSLVCWIAVRLVSTVKLWRFCRSVVTVLRASVPRWARRCKSSSPAGRRQLRLAAFLLFAVGDGAVPSR
jgi:hypothetical protein